MVRKLREAGDWVPVSEVIAAGFAAIEEGTALPTVQEAIQFAVRAGDIEATGNGPQRKYRIGSGGDAA